MSIQQIVTLALPLIAAIISYSLQQAKWSDKANTIVAGLSVIAAAVLSLFVDGKLTGNVYADAALVVTAAVALQSGSFLPLQRYLIANFPANSKPSQPDPAPVAPTPIQLSTPPTAKDLTNGN